MRQPDKSNVYELCVLNSSTNDVSSTGGLNMISVMTMWSAGLGVAPVKFAVTAASLPIASPALFTAWTRSAFVPAASGTRILQFVMVVHVMGYEPPLMRISAAVTGAVPERVMELIVLSM